MENLPRVGETEETTPPVESETTPKTEETEVVGDTKEEQPAEAPVSYQKRINELTYKYKSEREARVKLEEQLKSDRRDPAKPTSEEEQKEQDARDYLAKLVDERLSSIKSEEEQEERKLNDECDHVAALYPDFNKPEVLKIMDEFGIGNVEIGYNAWKKMSRVVQETKEQTKKDIISKPKSPSSIKTEDAFNSKFDDKTLQEKTIWELAEMAKKEAGY